jgi:hypothetical protein
MEPMKSTEAVEGTWNDAISPAERRRQVTVGSRVIDQDIARAWQLKAGLQWVRNDDGPLNRFRWHLWDRYGKGRPPSRVEKRLGSDRSGGLSSDGPDAPILRFESLESGSSRGIGSTGDPTPSGAVDHP